MNNIEEKLEHYVVWILQYCFASNDEGYDDDDDNDDRDCDEYKSDDRKIA